MATQSTYYLENATKADKALRKELSLTQLLLLSLGGIIGSGWLFAALYASEDANASAVLSWIIGGIVVLFVALVYAEVSGMIPRSGAIVRYPHYTHGSYVGYILGWAYLLSAASVPAIEAIASVSYLASYYPSLAYPALSTIVGTVTLLTPEGIGLAILLLVGFFFLNWFGIRLLGRFNQFVTWWKLLVPTLTFIFLFTAFHASNFSAGGFINPTLGAKGIFFAIPTAGIFFSYLGFRQALEYGGEAKKPQRDVPIAVIGSVLIGMFVYVMLQLAFVGSVNWTFAGVSVGNWGALGGTPTYGVAPFYSALQGSGVALLGSFASLLLVDAVISPSGTGWVYLGTSTRTLYGLGTDGYFGTPFMRLNRYRIPYIALLASLVIGVIFLAPFPSWGFLVTFITLATAFTYIMGGVAVQAFRRVIPDMKRPFRLPAVWLFAPIAFIAAAIVVYWAGFTYIALLTLAIFGGLPIYLFIYIPRRFNIPSDVTDILGLLTLIGVILLGIYGYYTLLYPGASGALTTAQLTSRFWPFFGGMALIGLGDTIVLLVLSRGHPDMTGGIWLIVFILGLIPLSYFGAFGYYSSPPLPFPYDNLVLIVFAAVIYAWAVLTARKTEELEHEIKVQDQVLVSEVPAQPEEVVGAPVAAKEM